VSVDVETFPDSGLLVESAGKRLIDTIHTAVTARGRALIVLTGGGNGNALLEYLGTHGHRIDWACVHLFWGDDRFVPHDDPNSNYGMAHDAMIAHVPIPPGNVHGIRFASSPVDAAREYEDELRAYYGSTTLDPARPLFDVVLLGMGPDGHTASLFPGKPALDERRRWVVEVPEPGLNPFVPRVTLTYSALNSARSAAFVAAGADKLVMMGRVLAGEQELPSARVSPVGELVWFVDRAARGIA